MFPYIWWILFYFKNVKICTYLYQLQCSFYTHLETFLFWFKICILPLHLINFVSDTWTMLCTAHTSIFHFKNLSRSATRFFRSACVLSVVAALPPYFISMSTWLSSDPDWGLHAQHVTSNIITPDAAQQHNINTPDTAQQQHNINTSNATQHQHTWCSTTSTNTTDAAQQHIRCCTLTKYQQT